jgi:hypothetical protein
VKRFLLVVAVLLVIGLVGLLAYRAGRAPVLHLQAELALRAALTAAATGTVPPGLELRLPTSVALPSPYAQAYTLEFIDTYPDQTGRAGWLGPRWRLWKVHFADGLTLEADVLPLSRSKSIVDVGELHQ